VRPSIQHAYGQPELVALVEERHDLPVPVGLVAQLHDQVDKLAHQPVPRVLQLALILALHPPPRKRQSGT
jgi:hypothetical protein